MKRILIILALCGSAQAQDLGPLDEYWAARGWYRSEGATVYSREAVSSYRNAQQLEQIERQQKEIRQQQEEILRRLEEANR